MASTITASAMGFPFAQRVEKPVDVDAVLKAFLEAKGPAFLDVRVDPFAFVYPMVGQGMSYKEMVTGDWIK